MCRPAEMLLKAHASVDSVHVLIVEGRCFGKLCISASTELAFLWRQTMPIAKDAIGRNEFLILKTGLLQEIAYRLHCFFSNVWLIAQPSNLYVGLEKPP